MKVEYIKDLQRRIWEYESAGVEASTKIQGAARKANEETQKIIEENWRLRLLLDQHGLSPSDMSGDDNTEPFPVNDGTQEQQGKVWQGSQNSTLLRKAI